MRNMAEENVTKGSTRNNHKPDLTGDDSDFESKVIARARVYIIFVALVQAMMLCEFAEQ
jgi:hypothetical protein